MKHFAILLLALLGGAAWAIPPDAPSNAELGKEDQQPAISGSKDQQDSGNHLAPGIDVPSPAVSEGEDGFGERADAIANRAHHAQGERAGGFDGEPAAVGDNTAWLGNLINLVLQPVSLTAIAVIVAIISFLRSEQNRGKDRREDRLYQQAMTTADRPWLGVRLKSYNPPRSLTPLSPSTGAVSQHVQGTAVVEISNTGPSTGIILSIETEMFLFPAGFTAPKDVSPFSAEAIDVRPTRRPLVEITGPRAPSLRQTRFTDVGRNDRELAEQHGTPLPLNAGESCVLSIRYDWQISEGIDYASLTGADILLHFLVRYEDSGKKIAGETSYYRRLGPGPNGRDITDETLHAEHNYLR